MARKPRKPAFDISTYFAVRLLVCLIQALPMTVGLRIAEFFGWVAYKVDRRHREVAADNIRHAFPEIASNPGRVDRLVRAMYRHFALMVVETVWMPRKLHVRSWRRYASMADGVRAISPFYNSRPYLMLTAHFGNWEFVGWLVGLFGFKIYAIARVLDHPLLERYVKRFRQGTGQTLIAKKDDFDRLTRVLRAGGQVGTLGDQDAGPRGLFVNFFGRPASTHKAVALMAIEFDAILTVAGSPRVAEPMFFSMECEDVIDPRDYADRPDAVRAITERYTAALERLIRRHPEQYFWLHRRWKSQPARKEKKPTVAQAA